MQERKKSTQEATQKGLPEHTRTFGNMLQHFGAESGQAVNIQYMPIPAKRPHVSIS